MTDRTLTTALRNCVANIGEDAFNDLLTEPDHPLAATWHALDTDTRALLRQAWRDRLKADFGRMLETALDAVAHRGEHVKGMHEPQLRLLCEENIQRCNLVVQKAKRRGALCVDQAVIDARNEAMQLLAVLDETLARGIAIGREQAAADALVEASEAYDMGCIDGESGIHGPMPTGLRLVAEKGAAELNAKLRPSLTLLQVPPVPDACPHCYAAPGSDHLSWCPIEEARNMRPTPVVKLRSCHRHSDCDAAEREARQTGKVELFDPEGPALLHCHDGDCPDCFPS